MKHTNVLEQFDEDEDYICFHPVKPIKIFGYELDNSECEIYISKEIDATEADKVLTRYLEWLTSCKKELVEYFHPKLGNDIPADWYECIEVYSTSITILASGDFGATVSFGESVCPDHIIECHFDQFKIVEDLAIG